MRLGSMGRMLGGCVLLLLIVGILIGFVRVLWQWFENVFAADIGHVWLNRSALVNEKAST